MKVLSRSILMSMLIIGLAVCVIAPTSAKAEDLIKDDITNQTVLVDKAIVTLNSFYMDKNMAWFTKHVGSSYGILILPQVIKGGFIFGGAVGKGVLIGRDKVTAEWSEPVFLSSFGASWGLQAGGTSSEVIVLIRSELALEKFYSSAFKFGGAGSVVVGPYGATGAVETALAANAPYVSFAKSKGAFAGLTFEASNIRINDKWNKEYYGRDTRPTDVLLTREVSNPKSAKLIEAVKRAEKIK